MITKRSVDLSAEDFAQFPVWEFDLSRQSTEHETWVVPVRSLPVEDLTNRIVGTNAVLADGTPQPVAIVNTVLHDPFMNAYAQIFCFMRNETSCEWASCGLVNHGAEGAERLAHFLGKSVSAVFPFSIDISAFAKGDEACIARLVFGTAPEDSPDPLLMAMHAALDALSQSSKERDEK